METPANRTAFAARRSYVTPGLRLRTTVRSIVATATCSRPLDMPVSTIAEGRERVSPSLLFQTGSPVAVFERDDDAERNGADALSEKVAGSTERLCYSERGRR